MLLWLRKNKPNQWRLIRNIFIFASFLHGMIFFAVFFCYRGSYDHYTININSRLLNPDARVVFMPFYKQVEKKVTKPAVAAIKKVETVAKKEPVKKIKPAEKAPTSLASNDKKKEQPKKIEPKKKASPKKVTPKKEVVAQTKKPEPVYVGRAQLDAWHMQLRMQKEVVKCWRPPAGVPKECECVIKIVVGTDGKAVDLELLKTSNVLMYDVSARSAMLAMQLPPWAAGKEFTITFRQ